MVFANECLNCLSEKIRMILVSIQRLQLFRKSCLPTDYVCDQNVGENVDNKGHSH